MKVIVVAGAQAGVGKTTFAVGLMAALRQRGLRVQGFKVGPDLLDPLLHEAATGRPSFNLDGWMLSREYNLACVSRLAADADVAVIEGGETLFDGDDDDERGSAGQIAKWLGAPVLLVVDCELFARHVLIPPRAQPLAPRLARRERLLGDDVGTAGVLADGPHDGVVGTVDAEEKRRRALPALHDHHRVAVLVGSL